MVVRVLVYSPKGHLDLSIVMGISSPTYMTLYSLLVGSFSYAGY